MQDSNEGETGSTLPSDREADVLHIRKQIKFVQVLLELAEEAYTSGDFTAAYDAQANARSTLNEMRLLISQLNGGYESFLAELEILEDVLKNLTSRRKRA